MRIVLIYRKPLLGLLLTACLAAPAPAAGQAMDSLSVARRTVAAASLAVKEYANGVPPTGGAVTAPEEVSEAKEFLEHALLDLGSLPVAVRATADADMRAMVAMIDRKVAPDSVAARAAALIRRITAATGAALDPFPGQPPSLARGAAVFKEQCVQCHGEAGHGDGPKARHLEGPPPADLADRTAMADVSPVDAYRKVTIGVAGTAMPEFEESLSPDDRWAVATYIATLRTDDAMIRAGSTLYTAKCASCHGSTGGGDGPFVTSLSVRLPALRDLAVQGPLTDRDLDQLVLHGKPGVPMPGVVRALNPRQVSSLVAFLRVLPAAEHQQELASREAVTFAAVRRQIDSAVTLRSDKMAFDAYLTFEQVEPAVRARNPGLATDLESAFAVLRSQTARGSGGGAELEAIRARLLGDLERAERLVSDRGSAPTLFMQSFVLLLREGFEAILIVAALMAFLHKAGATHKRRHVAEGAWAAVGASIVTALLIELLFEITPGQREALEGITMLLATAILFYVSYWLLSKIEVAKWNAFVKGRMEDALSSGSGYALASVAFLAVYREGFETILFYKALLTSAGPASGGTAAPAVAAGILAGAVALLIVYAAIDRFGMRVPLKPFFAVTSGMLYYMAFVFAGKGIADLQESGLLRTTVVEWAPRVPVLGIYPTVQSLFVQVLLIVLLLVAVVWLQRDRFSRTGQDRRPSFP